MIFLNLSPKEIHINNPEQAKRSSEEKMPHPTGNSVGVQSASGSIKNGNINYLTYK